MRITPRNQLLLVDDHLGLGIVPNPKHQPHHLSIYHFTFNPLWLPRSSIKIKMQDFPGGTVVKNPPANAGDTGSNPGLGRSHMPRSN